jgi:nucleoside-diphosphate-sugar epimerase
MNILLTGAFGNIGRRTLDELVGRGHRVRCFDLPSAETRRMAARLVRRHGDRIDLQWGDLCCRQDLVDAVRDQQAIVHLAFIIPKNSATGVDMAQEPAWARQVNVGGTQNLLSAMHAQVHPPRILFASSISVYGRTQSLQPPRVAEDPVDPVDPYTRHKVECERMVRDSGLRWAIFRLAAALPLDIRFEPTLFDIALDTRMEFVHPRDVALAIANAMSVPDVWGRVLLIGGGPACQHRFREIVERIFGAIGVGMLPEEAFGPQPFYTDWLDTAQSQRLLRYQQHCLDDYIRELKAKLGVRRHLARVFRPLVRRWLLRKSPYASRTRAGTEPAPRSTAARGAPAATR